MDDPAIPKDVHAKALKGLTRLNAVSGVRGAMYRRLRRIAMTKPGRRLRLIDVASGAGDLPIDWARRAKRDSIDLQITTIDISHTAVEIQLENAKRAGVTINAIQGDCLHDALPSGFDMATCSLFVHHLDNHEVFCLLQSMQAASTGAIMVCDLYRSRANLAFISIAAQMFSRSPIVHHDASLSVRSAYTCDEFKRIAEEALARPVEVKMLFPSRFIMTLREEVVLETSADPAVAFA
ncbi:hypothetical protein Pla22_26180 [Rubripirellula amarantea]|uniref:Methyltransferase domain-containing protein n=2 Tax=Rubripirellula amarantea TaxID=2527999 RepID=A0A5C5WVJ2_9BACT|nr:hypothetical protein Pla22_26180 [Rubripirellula amarantea]